MSDRDIKPANIVLPDGSIVFSSYAALVAWAEDWARTQRRAPVELEIETVQKAVASHFDLRMADLRSKRKLRSIVRPRMIAMYLCRQLVGSSYPEIGMRFGGKDHSTVINAIKRIEQLVLVDGALAASIDTIRARIISRGNSDASAELPGP